MDDLELTKACARAMGITVNADNHNVCWWPRSPDEGYGKEARRYDPLHNDAQAMALVKRFSIDIEAPYSKDLHPTWTASSLISGDSGYRNADLNRAIVECVSKLGAAHD